MNLKMDPEGKLFCSAKSGANNIPYEVDIDLFDKVDVNVSALDRVKLSPPRFICILCQIIELEIWQLQESKASVGLRNICYLVKKAEKKWWSRLLKARRKTSYIFESRSGQVGL